MSQLSCLSFCSFAVGQWKRWSCKNSQDFLQIQASILFSGCSQSWYSLSEKQKKKKKKSYGAIFYSFISKWKCLKSLFKLEKSNKPNTRNSILATSGTAKKQRDWIHQLFIPMEEGKHRDFGLHFTRKAGWRLFLERWFWGVRSEVEWSTLGSHLCVTTSLEERGLPMGKDDSRILPHDTELFQIHPLPAVW